MATRVARQAFCQWEPGAIGCADARRSFEVRDTVIKTSLSKEKRMRFGKPRTGRAAR
jgi:hypothetical protein